MSRILAIITWDTMSAEFYAQQIRTFFGAELQIAIYSVQSGNINQIEPAVESTQKHSGTSGQYQ